MTVVAGRKRRSAAESKDAKFTRLNVVIDHDAYKRLMVNSVMSGESPGMFLERLINDHCKEWQMPAAGASVRKAKKTASVDPDGIQDRAQDGAEMNQGSNAA